ncbi:MAG: Ig-like domain-containing protein [Phycisphaerae bacterium]|nr:Ig-like domain-containing protein [Phycisphaerae bacterium]
MLVASVSAMTVSSSAAAQSVDPAPRIVAVSPSPAGGIHDQVGLPSLDVTFTEPVTVGTSPLVWGTAGGLLSSSTQLLGGGFTLRISFAGVVADDRLTIVLGDEITDLAGNPLDGEIAVPGLGSLPSGDGVPGGLAVLRYDVLKGDVNGDGVTNPSDAALLVAALGACAGDPDFSSEADLNNDGCVNVLDVQIVLSGQGGSLPPLDGAAPTISSISRADGSPLTEDLELLAITFSEELTPLSVIEGVISMRDFDGTTFFPTTTVLGGDGRTIECHFAPPISACGNHTVAISNAVADLSGELFVPPAQAPGFTGSTPPATPVLNKYTAITSAAGVTISGTIPQKAGFAIAVEVRVQGPDQIVTASATGTFSVTMPLEANEINYLYVSAISPCGIASAPVVAEVTRDNTAPNLTIQFPADTRQIFDEFVNVGGTVGDTLSGFEGLTVSVNGQRAVVDIALGQNGTWLAENVQLNRPSQPTILNVVATDVVGNTVTKSLTVTRVAPPRNAPYLEVLSGDDQVGLVGTALPVPIAVKVWKADGTPYANKLVDFRVTQNDGRLSGRGYGSDTMFYQVLTDASGVASASWTLGGTAGCGNHRVEATAKEVAGIALFSATAAADTPDQINIGSGNNQRVEVGSPAPLPLSAWVSDATNPVANVPVTFTVTSGGGLVNGQSQITVPSDATGHADVEFTTGLDAGVNRVEATFPGNKTSPAVFTTYGIVRDYTKPTSFRGLVLDNASRPIGNVKVTLKFGTTLVGPKLTNEQGQFEFTDLTNDGAVHVIVEGFLANKLNGQPLPPGVKFPSLGYDTSIVPNAENTLGKPILLPPMLPENTVTWDGQSDIELTCAGMEGLVFRVKANSMTLENGSTPTVNAPVKLSLNQVHHDDIPMPMPNGVAPAFAWTFQPAAATFDPPVEIEYPNMSVLPPGAMAYFLTFNHDLGEFEIMCPGRVSEDGSTIVTEPGTGLRLSGWGCNCPPYSVTGECKKKFRVAVGIFEGGFQGVGPLPLGVLGNYFEVNNFEKRLQELDPQGRITARIFSATSLTDFTGLGQLSPANAWLNEIEESQGSRPKVLLAGYSLGADSVALSDWIPADWRLTGDPISREAALVGEQFPCPNGGCNVMQTNCLILGRTSDENIRSVPSLDFQVGCAIAGPWCLNGEGFANCASGYSIAGVDADYPDKNHATISHVIGPAVLNRAQQLLAAAGGDDQGNDDRRDAPSLGAGFDLSIAGQHVTSDGSGAFSIHNITAADSFGQGGPGTPPDFVADDPLRVVGSAVVDGKTWYVISEPFQLATGEAFLVDGVTITDVPPPLPSDIELATSPLLVVGQSIASSVIGTFSDGSSQDLTPATAWTTYRTSNPLVATVDKDGVVAAHQQGTVFITATNNAATAVKKILVTNDAAPTTIVGFVQLEDGTPVENAVLVTPLGGKGVSGRDGSFSFKVEVGQQTSSLNVTAVATVGGVTYSGTKLVSPTAIDGVTDAGAIAISAEASCSGDFGWMSGFGLPGMNNGVSALTVFDDGSGGGPSLYAGGGFTSAGGVAANYIAKWNGTSWLPLGTDGTNGVNLFVSALTIFDDGLGGGPALYAGGRFTTAGGVAANYIAKWNGTSWSSLGTGGANGVNFWVNALTVFDDGSGGGPALYAAGYFTTAGGVAANAIAKWDGTSWSPLGTGSTNGLNGFVLSLAVLDDGSSGGPALYAGGDFAAAGGVTANRIAKWDGASWSPLGTGAANGVNNRVWGLTVFDDGSGGGPALYAGGDFAAAGGVSANGIAKWDGTSWSPLATGVFGAGQSVRALTVFDDGSGGGPALYAAGSFTTAGGVAANAIAKWDGTSWSPLGAGSANGVNLDITTLTVLGDGTGGGPALYVGGNFTTAGGGLANRIAEWDGTSWSPLHSAAADGLNGDVYSLAVFDDGEGGGPALYVGGDFTTAGGVAANRIAKWDGISWSPLGTGASNGLSGSVSALSVFDDGLGGGPALYAGGFFVTAGGVPASRIAKWDGTSWSPLGTGAGNGLNSPVSALNVFDDGSGKGPALFVGGSFTMAGGVSASGIASWDGTSWSPLGAGVTFPIPGYQQVNSLAVFDDGSGGGPALYAAGYFEAAGGFAANNIARWDGRAWSPLGTGITNGVNSVVRTLSIFDGGSNDRPLLYVGGSFTAAGGVTALYIGKWDGRAWSPLIAGAANGVNVDVYALTVFDDGSGGGAALYVGGRFSTAGGVTANRVAKWDGASWSPLTTGASNGVSNDVNVLGVFDDGSSGGLALYVGGAFATAGGVPSSNLAKWGCVETASDAPGRPQRAIAGRGAVRTTPQRIDTPTDRTLRSGESLILCDESLRFGTLTALSGSTLRLTHPNAHLTVTNLIIEPGATFEWIAGTIEIDAGAWLHPYELTVGCDREAKLLLTHDAFVRAPQVTVCSLGSLVGQGVVDAPTTNAGSVAGEGGGVRILGTYRHEPSGTVAASIGELDAIALADVHPCTAFDEVDAAAEIEPLQRLDVDHDGDLDLIRRVRLSSETLSLLWLNRGDGSYGSPILCGSEIASQRVSIEHLDEDGLLDLLLTDPDGRSCRALSGSTVEVVR